MKKYLLALALLLTPSFAFAQCNGVFPNNTVCGNVTGANNTPRPTAPSAFLGAAGGTNGQIQFNNAGALGGFTASGDATVNTSTGVVTLNPIANNTLLANTSGGTAHPVSTAPAGLWDSFCSSGVGQFWVRLSSAWGCTALGYANPVWFGADPTGSADSAPAINSAIATGLPVLSPPGKFKVNSLITKTFANNTDCFSFRGSGKGITIFNFPNAAGSLLIDGTGFGVNNCLEIAYFTALTAQNGGGNGIELLNGGISVRAPSSAIHDVALLGADFAGTGLNFWTVGIFDHNWSGIAIQRVDVHGDSAHAFGSQGGTAIQIEGDAATSAFVQSIKVSDSNLEGNNVVVLGSFWQGIFFHTCNIGGSVGVLVGSSQTGQLEQLTISDGIFFADFAAVSLNSPTTGVQLLGNNVFVSQTSAQGGFFFRKYLCVHHQQ